MLNVCCIPAGLGKFLTGDLAVACAERVKIEYCGTFGIRVRDGFDHDVGDVQVTALPEAGGNGGERGADG